MSISSLIHTSVSDAKISLEHLLERDPISAADSAVSLLEAIQGVEGQTARRKMAASVLRKAAKQLAEG